MKHRIAAILLALCLGASMCLAAAGCDVVVGEAESEESGSGTGDEMLDNTEENADDDDNLEEDAGDEDMEGEIDMAMDDMFME